MTYPSAKDKLISGLLAIGSCWGCEERPIVQEPKTEAPSSRAKDNQAPIKDSPECPTWTAARTLGRQPGTTLHEISGLVAGSAPNTLWAHNDSGDQARLYALEANGKHVATVTLPMPAFDWEDMARRSKKGRSLLYVADTGDNLSVRTNGVSIHQFEEPDLAQARTLFPAPLEVKEVRTMKVRYPGGPRDTEALLVDPLSDEIVLITKPRMELPEIYSTVGFSDAATLKFEGKISPEHCGQLIHLVTAADISPDGRWIIVRTYDDVLLFERNQKQTMAEALHGRACFVPHVREPQGEAIGFVSFTGSNTSPLSFVTMSEGANQPLLKYEMVTKTK